MPGAKPPHGPDQGRDPAGGQSRGFVAFDALRCLAALAVLFNHTLNLFVASPTSAAPLWARIVNFLGALNHQAVIAFFVLSGFWISKSIAERQAAGRWSWPDYAIDRLSRLWMVLIPGLIVGGILDVLALRLAPFPFSALGKTIVAGDFGARLTPWAFFGNIAFLQELKAPIFGSNTTLWSLANEFWYYLWFPALVGLARRRVAVPPTLAAAASLIAFPSLLPGFLCWLCGAGLYAASVRWRAPRWAPWPAIIVGMALLLAIRWETARADLLVSIVVAVVLWCVGEADFKVMRPLAAFGRQSSYSLYVCHTPPLVLAAALLLPGARLPYSAAAMLTVAGLCAAAVVYGWGFSRATEAHTDAVRRWLRAASRQMMGMGAAM